MQHNWSDPCAAQLVRSFASSLCKENGKWKILLICLKFLNFLLCLLLFYTVNFTLLIFGSWIKYQIAVKDHGNYRLKAFFGLFAAEAQNEH